MKRSGDGVTGDSSWIAVKILEEEGGEGEVISIVPPPGDIIISNIDSVR